MRVALKTFLVVLLIAVTTFALLGCEKKQSSQNTASQSSASIDDPKQEKDSESASKIEPVEDKKVQKIESSKIKSIRLYFADFQGEKLMPESRNVNSQSNLLKAAITQLIIGPESKDLVGTIPEGTKLLNLDTVNGTAIVNFSGELSANHWGGSTMEALTVESIVRTLTQFDDIKEVRILLDGSTAETIAGHVDISKPLSGDSTIGTP